MGRFMYVTSNCVQCKMSEQIIDESKWTVHDVTGDDAMIERIRSQGYQQFPVCEVFGKYGLLTSWTGFRPDRIRYWEGNSAKREQP